MSKKEQLLEVAIRHFNRYGYHATGIDRILKDSGIAKMTLYRHFPSKEDLIVESLRVLDERYRRNMREAVDEAARPEDKLLATFDYLEQWFSQTGFYGCPFMSASSEYCDPGHPVFQEVSMHKRLVVAYFEELAKAAGYPQPARLAEGINLLHEGATAIAQVSGSPDAARLARELARGMLEAGRAGAGG